MTGEGVPVLNVGVSLDVGNVTTLENKNNCILISCELELRLVDDYYPQKRQFVRLILPGIAKQQTPRPVE